MVIEGKRRCESSCLKHVIHSLLCPDGDVRGEEKDFLHNDDVDGAAVIVGLWLDWIESDRYGGLAWSATVD